MQVFQVPKEFKQRMVRFYPPHVMTDLIEGFAERYYSSLNINSDWTYLPVRWTSWFVNNDYGKRGHFEMSRFLQGIPKRKYFTICQNDDGTLYDDILKSKGCTIFTCGCGKGIPAPLLCDSHGVTRKDKPKYLASFVGSVNTHPIRQKMIDSLAGKEGYYIGYGNTDLFREVMCDSYFALCPRGYGPTSFRLYEAIDMGVVPVYISDEFVMPFENRAAWPNFCVKVKAEELGDLDEIIKKALPAVEGMRENCMNVYQKFFNYKAACDQIIIELGRL